MAARYQVKRYLAYWFQLGKPVVVQAGRTTILPKTVIAGDRYSDEFETCWQFLLSPESGECHLEGSHHTIEDLLTSKWDIADCARCSMPVPMLNQGVSDLSCPCNDMPNWPDMSLPPPRSPVNSQMHLSGMRDRLHHRSSAWATEATSADSSRPDENSSEGDRYQAS